MINDYKMTDICVVYDSDLKSFAKCQCDNKDIKWNEMSAESGKLFLHESVGGYDEYEHFIFTSKLKTTNLYLALIYEENHFVCAYEGYYSYDRNELINLIIKQLPLKLSKHLVRYYLTKTNEFKFDDHYYHFGVDVLAIEC